MASLLELVEALVRDPAAKAAYRADPDEFLGRHGFGGLEPADFEEALHHAADSFPPTLAAHVDPAQGFDTLVHVDLQELGFDDELRPLDPLDEAPPDPVDWHGPPLGDDVDLDAPPGGDDGPDRPDGGSPGDLPEADGTGDRAGGVADQIDADADGDGPGAGAPDAGTADGPAEAGADAAAGGDPDLDAAGAFDAGDAAAALDEDLDAGDGTADGVDGTADPAGGDGLGLDTLVDQPATAAWEDDPFDRPGLGPDSDDPWFYNQDEPSFDAPDDVDDDILDDVDDFHHDG